MAVQDWTEPNVCVDEHLGIDEAGDLRLLQSTVPHIVAEAKAFSGADGTLFPVEALPGKLLINQKLGWRNEGVLDAMIQIRVTRASKSWITSNPNAIQFRDRWTWIIDADDLEPEVPLTTSIFNSQAGSAIDLGTNSVAEPNPGLHYVWASANTQDEWVGPVEPGQKINVWYRCYVWTPPRFSDNANKNQPIHEAYARWVKLKLTAFFEQADLVSGSRRG